MAKNYYVILGISPRATGDDIKAAYRRLAKESHPDRYGGNLRTFLDIREAYSVLGDENRRREYDERLSERTRPPYQGFSKYATPSEPEAEPLIPGQGPAHLHDISLVRSFQTFAPSFDEIFERLWNNLRGLAQPKSEEIQNLTVEVPITPDQAQRGGQARILVPGRACCPTCSGCGAVGYYECPRCAGEGCIAGELPVNISFPPGLSGTHTVLVSLERFGIRNCYLSVNFRVTAGTDF